MKFSLAVGILSQTLPVVSETTVSEWWDSKRQRDGQSLNGKDRLSTIISLGRSRRGRFQQGRTANPSGRWINRKKQQSRQLMNAPTTAHADVASEAEKVQVCDPTVSDPDVGILSCGPDAHCTPNVSSVLGGFCVPFSSPSSSSSSASFRHEDAHRMSTSGKGKLKNLSSQSPENLFCDPFSTDPDIGVLSCGKRRQCQPTQTSTLGGECKAVDVGPSLINIGTKSIAVECVPTEVDKDGFRLCDIGQICVESMESNLGGFCVAIPDARHLQWDNDVVLCDSQFYANYDCDCSAFDTSTQSGAIACLSGTTCVGSYYYGCYDTCRTHTTKYGFVNKELRSIEQCYEFIAGGDTTTSSAVCFKFPSNYTSCDVLVDGQACSSCAISDSSLTDFGFDCTNVADGFAGDSFTSLPIIQACYLPVDGVDCNLCGSNSSFIPSGDDTLISLDGFGDLFTCSGLSSANSYHQLSAEKCSEAASVAASDCCVYQCDICGYGRILRESTALDPITVSGFGPTTCYDLHYAGYVNYSIPESNCPALRESIGDTCCVDYYKSVDCKVCDYGYFIPSSLDSTLVTVVEGTSSGDYSTCLDIDSAAYGHRTETSTTTSTLDVNCTVLQDVGATTCCRPYVESCHVCGLGKFISYNNHEVAFNGDATLGTMSCYDIYYGSYMGGTIVGETCSRVQQLAAQSCCETLTGYDECRVCGTADIAFPDATITSGGDGGSTVSCAWVGDYGETGYLDATECEYLTLLAGTICCAPTNRPTTVPTMAPMEASDPAEPSPITTTTSGSTTSDGGANSTGASSAGSSSGTTSLLPTPVVGTLAGILAFGMALLNL